MPLELLESRIAPAHVVQLIDVDGDLVTVTQTQGQADLLTHPEGQGVAIDRIEVGADATDTQITLSVERVPGGDGRVDVLLLEASGRMEHGLSACADLRHPA